MGPNVHTVEESGRCQHLSSLGTDFRAVHAVMGESFLRGREYSTAHGSRNVTVGGIPAISGGPSGNYRLLCGPAMQPGPRRLRSQLE